MVEISNNFIALDPVLGDNGQLYVPRELISIYQDLIPYADLLTPNQYEAEYFYSNTQRILSDMEIHTLDDAKKAVAYFRTLGVKQVVLTSTTLNNSDNLFLIGANESEFFMIEFPKIDFEFTGTGDLFAALLVGYSARSTANGSLKSACERAITTIQIILQRTRAYSLDSLKERNINPMELKAFSTLRKHVELRLIESMNDILNSNVISYKAIDIKE